eukprot:scaffold28188_cov66-Phaeocystis_antarctica.AAC.1
MDPVPKLTEASLHTHTHAHTQISHAISLAAPLHEAARRDPLVREPVFYPGVLLAVGERRHPLGLHGSKALVRARRGLRVVGIRRAARRQVVLGLLLLATRLDERLLDLLVGRGVRRRVAGRDQHEHPCALHVCKRAILRLHNLPISRHLHVEGHALEAGVLDRGKRARRERVEHLHGHDAVAGRAADAQERHAAVDARALCIRVLGVGWQIVVGLEAALAHLHPRLLADDVEGLLLRLRLLRGRDHEVGLADAPRLVGVRAHCGTVTVLEEGRLERLVDAGVAREDHVEVL